MKNALDARCLRLTLPLAALVVALLVGLSGCMQNPENAADETTEQTVEQTVADVEVEVSGRDMYEAYCASCHGPEARGNGPVASALTVPPPDLTLIRARRGGTFPVDDLYRMIDGREEVPAHGTREMPIWGNTWGEVDGVPQSKEVIEQRINLLIEYLRSIQTEGDG